MARLSESDSSQHLSLADRVRGGGSKYLLVTFLGFFTAVLALNVIGGAFDSDLGGDPDEAAHAVTALMVRDYVAGHLGEHPMRFAEGYYERFPKIALGHYPPLFYVVAGVWMLPLVSMTSLLILEAICAGLLAMMTFVVLRSRVGGAAAVTGGLLMVLLPTIQKLSQHVMSDVLLGLFCLLAAWIWSAYLDKPSWFRALAFGVVATAAILTKGSGMLLGLLPPVATVLAGRWRLFFKPSLWLAAVPVVLVAGPWMLYSTQISKEGMTLLSPLEYFWQAAPYYITALPHVFGWGLLLLAGAGLAGMLTDAFRERRLDALDSSLAGLAVGSLAVLLLIPVGLTTRYLLPLIPWIIYLAARGAAGIGTRLGGRAWLAPVVLAATATVAIDFPKKEVSGFGEAVAWVRRDVPESADHPWIVSSDPRGEGAIVAAAAFGEANRVETTRRVFRAGKELAASDWMGRDYEAKFDSPEALLDHLEQESIRVAFVDLSAGEEARLPHERLLERALSREGSGWKLVRNQPVVRRSDSMGELLVFVR